MNYKDFAEIVDNANNEILVIKKFNFFIYNDELKRLRKRIETLKDNKVNYNTRFEKRFIEFRIYILKIK